MNESNGTHHFLLDGDLAEAVKEQRDWARAKAIEFEEAGAYRLAQPYVDLADRLTLALREYGFE